MIKIDDADEFNAAIAATGQLSLLEELRIRLAAMDPQISFAPLAALPLLRRLAVTWFGSQRELSDAQVDQLRALPRLQKLRILEPMRTPLLGPPAKRSAVAECFSALFIG